MKSLQVIGTKVWVDLPTQSLRGTIIEIDNTQHFSHYIKTDLGYIWCSLEQIEIDLKGGA